MWVEVLIPEDSLALTGPGGHCKRCRGEEADDVSALGSPGRLCKPKPGERIFPKFDLGQCL